MSSFMGPQYVTRKEQENIRQQQIKQWTQLIKCKTCKKIFPRNNIKCEHIKDNNNLEIATDEEGRQYRNKEVQQNERTKE